MPFVSGPFTQVRRRLSGLLHHNAHNTTTYSPFGQLNSVQLSLLPKATEAVFLPYPVNSVPCVLNHDRRWQFWLPTI